jgi:hypothetical protein
MGSEYRGASWSFRTRVIIPPNTTHDYVERLLENIFTRDKPDSVTNIEARYKKSELSAQALPLKGYIQLSRGLLTSKYHLARWIPNTEWTPVGGRLARNDDYIKYHESKKTLQSMPISNGHAHGEPEPRRAKSRSAAEAPQPDGNFHLSESRTPLASDGGRQAAGIAAAAQVFPRGGAGATSHEAGDGECGSDSDGGGGDCMPAGRHLTQRHGQ